jgi:N,N'-diacetyllegionaminate synthase
MKTLIIAEAGVNHNGNLDLALEMVDVAASSGADIVKFQTFKAESLVTAEAPKAAYQIRETSKIENQKEMLKDLEMSFEMHDKIIERCKKKNIEFLSTAFDTESLNYLISLGIKRIKIPSGEITNFFLLEEAAKFNLEIILSTGMSNINEIEQALDVLFKNGIKNNRITLLQCTTNYPASIHDANLNVLETLSKTFNVSVGLSDHTMGINVSIAAAALGSKVIEKHFTLDRSFSGPDHAASLEPKELAALCNAIREVNQSMGTSEKLPSINEKENIHPARKSLVAKKRILKGDKFTRDNVTAKRPADGISPMRWPEVKNRVAKKEFFVDEKIEI